MKYRDFKAELDKYFKDDDEIYPHAGWSCVSFYRFYHGQPGGLIETEGDMVNIDFMPTSDLGITEEGE